MKSKLTLYSLLGVFSVCIGIAFLNNTLLGNDPIGVFYDGIREFSGFSQPELGKVSNYINIILLVFLFVCGRNYFSVGTFLYLIPYGSFISIGSRVYSWLFVNIDSSFRIIISILGCLLYYFGISLFIACNIGTDPFNGFVFAIQDKIGWSLRKIKINLDILLVIIGVILGGKAGVFTIVTALTTGPVVQCLSGYFSKQLHPSES